MKNDIINLIVVKKTPDQDGFEQETQIPTEVFADIRSIRSTEFYQAAHEGISVKIAAAINVDDYETAAVVDEITQKKTYPSLVDYEGTTYRIVRDYKTSKLRMELTLQEVE